MKQTILKKTTRQVFKGRTAVQSSESSRSPVDRPEKPTPENSPWLMEIQNALSPYWSARITR